MKFRILGPLEILDGGGEVVLDAPKQRALLGVLLLHANEAVSTERLIDELWGERPPASAAKVLQTYVWKLRRLVGTDTIASRPPGYLIRVEEEALDATRFRNLTSEARRLASKDAAEEARARYSEALALWRGPPLADVVLESFARSEVERLEEERLNAVIDLIDCELALAHHDEVLLELEMLVRQHPLRERLRRQLMLALYRSGRQADALAVYQDTRRTLVDELGLEPGRELQDLERAVLLHDPALEPPPRPTPATESPPVPKAFAVRRLLRRPALALAALLLLAVAFGLGFALRRDHHPVSMLLAPDSVGFIDAGSGRVTRSFEVGRGPSSLIVANEWLWVANYRDETVTRIDLASGQRVTIAVRGHPTALTAYQGKLWVWTIEGLLIPIDQRFAAAGEPLSMGEQTARRVATEIRSAAPDTASKRAGGGRITSGGGFLWATVPPTMVIRVRLSAPARATLFHPDDGANGAIAYRNGKAWIAGYDEVFPIAATTRVAGPGIRVGSTRDLTVAWGSLWVVGGRQDQGIREALRRVDPHAGVVEATVEVGDDPVAVAWGAGSIWVASRNDRMIRRVNPGTNRTVERIPLGGPPTALAGAADGVWVAVG